MLAAAHQHGGKQHIGLVERLGLQIGGDRKLAKVVFRFAHDLLEVIVRDLDVGEIEIDQIGMKLSALQRCGVRIVADHRLQAELVGVAMGARSLLCQNRIKGLGGLVENPLLVALRQRSERAGRKPEKSGSEPSDEG